MVLLRIVRAKSSPNTFLPSTPMTSGDAAWTKVCGGHSTNFAKLYKNAALIWYSVGAETCAELLNAGTKIRLASKAIVRQSVNVLRSGFFLRATGRIFPGRMTRTPLKARQDGRQEFFVCRSHKIAFYDGGFSGRCQVRWRSHFLLAAFRKPSTIQFRGHRATIVLRLRHQLN